MEKYRGLTVVVVLVLLVGAALSETFLKIQWSTGLLALIGVPLTALFAEKVATAIKDRSTQRTADELAAPTTEGDAKKP